MDEKDKEWYKEVKRQLGHVCNGEISEIHDGLAVCKMQNGKVSVAVAGDGARMVSVVKYHPRAPEVVVQRVNMESYGDDLVITRSLSGSIEFLHKMGQSPEVRIEQVGTKGKKLGMIKIFSENRDVRTAVYAHIDV